MDISIRIKNFLVAKMHQEKLSRKEIAAKCDISYGHVNRLVSAKQPRASIDILLRIAKTYNVSIGSVLGIEEKIVQSNISVDDAQNNLKLFVKKKLAEEEVRASQLATVLGFNETSIKEFLDEPPKKQSLGTPIVLALSKHWGVSIDEMIGRTAPAQSLAQEKEAETNIPREIKDKLNPRGEKELEDIKAALKGVAASNARSTPTTTPPIKKIKKKEGVGIEG